MYTMQERIGISKTDKDGRVKLVSAIDMLQDCSLLWLESEPVYAAYLTKHGIGQLITFRQLDVIQLPAYKEQVTICTSVFEFNGFFGYRNTAIYNSKGEPYVLSWSVGVFVDLANGNVVRLPQSVLDTLNYDEKIDMPYLPKKITLPDIEPETLPTLQIRRSDIDMNNHVNNARYVEIAMEALPMEYACNRLRVEYKHQARLGDALYPKRIQVSGSQYYIVLAGQDGTPYTVMEFTQAI